MNNSLLINELASDIAKLSKTLSILAEEIISAHTQESVEKATQMTQESVKVTGESSSSSTSTEDTKPVVTIEQVRAVMAEKSQAGLTSQVKELLEKFGANKLSAIKPDDYEALLEAASQMK